MKQLDSVTLVAVTSVKIEETIKALKKSMKGITYAEVLLITDKTPDLTNTGIQHVPIEALDYKAYSHFLLYRLKDFIKTDFALIVQHDGYVLRPQEWSNEFLKYDYIGAPWPKNVHYTAEGVNVRVGNGGFSLRSKKLLEAPSKLNLPFSDSGSGYFNEDGIICVHERKNLEAYGIAYAPVEIAARFSIEKKCEDSYPTPFGFHNNAKRFQFNLLKKIGLKIKYTYREHRKIGGRIISSWLNDITTSGTIATTKNATKIYDIFTFFNELDLLDIRLNILGSYVDYFVIVESTVTFSGKPKPLYYQDNKARFKKWEHKIIHHVIDDTPIDAHEGKRLVEDQTTSDMNKIIISEALVSDNVGRDKNGNILDVWFREFFQKESLKKPLTNLTDDDFCFVGDVDEIWDPQGKINLTSDRVFKLRQKMYAYYLNNRSSEPWIGPIATKYKNIKHGILNHLRTERKMNYIYVRNGGWHFTNMGGAEQIKKKLDSYGHQEYNTEKIRSQIEQQIKDNKDFIGRKFTFWIDESDLPSYVVEHKEKYKHYFKEY